MTDIARQLSISAVTDRIMATSRGSIKDYDYELVLDYVIWGMRDLRVNHSMNAIRYSKQTPGSLNEISFPSDMEEVIGIAVPVSGKIWFLTKDDRIITTTTVSGTETQDEDAGEGVDLDTLSGEDLFSTAKNPEGYFTVDWVNTRIMLNNISRTEVILVYKSSGVSSDTYIPNKYFEAIKAYVYKEYFCTPETPAAQKQMYIMDYNAAITKLKQHELNMLDIMDTIKRSYRPLPTK